MRDLVWGFEQRRDRTLFPSVCKINPVVSVLIPIGKCRNEWKSKVNDEEAKASDNSLSFQSF